MPNTFTIIPVDSLKLDLRNPRLPEDRQNEDEIYTINWMLESANLLDLMGSISQNNFFSGEPIIVEQDKSDNKYIVIEGNRRVAAVKLLKRPELAKSNQSIVRKLSIEAENKNHIPNELQVYLVESKNKLIDNYLGFRHVSGVRPWPVIAKARYLRTLFDSHPNKNSPSVFKDLAKEIGTKTSYVKRLLYGHDLYILSKSNNWFGVEDIDEETFDVSLITDAATMHSAISEYMGVDYDDPVSPFKNINHERVKEIFNILYNKNVIKNDGTKTTRLGDNRKLRILNKVVSDKQATKTFLSSNISLEAAAELAGVTEESFRESISKAKNYTRHAQSLVHKVESVNDADVNDIREMIQSCYIIEQYLTKKLIENQTLNS